MVLYLVRNLEIEIIFLLVIFLILFPNMFWEILSRIN